MASDPDKPVLIEIDGDTGSPSPADAPAVPDLDPGAEETAAMGRAIRFAGRRGSVLGRAFWSLLLSVITFAASVALWDFVTGLFGRSDLLGWIATGLLGLFGAVTALIVLRELAALGRLRRVDRLQGDARHAAAEADLSAARNVVARLDRLYAARPDTAWGRARLAEARADVLDADGLLAVAERELLGSLDRAAQDEIASAARQVATVTAIVPIAFADLLTALTANVRMIRRIAEIYGGRSGTLGGWRLTRAVMAHLVATGAVAVGDDLIGSVAGGSVLGRVSRRFGEGVVNGALTARVGVAALEVCRPLPFTTLARPSVSALVRRALTGFFG